ncbi:MAG TPA: hypothetical protein VGQ15_04575 [Gaiellaceae bacterium]|jgi:hypothetical protein|nr:hypothetical protein [Gaiellaceae bacterium]
MKRSLLSATVVLLAFAGAALAAPTAPPQSPPDGPDLAVMALGPADFPGAKVDAQKYIAVSPGTVAVYERDLTPSSGPLAYISDEVDLYAKATKAQSDAAGFKRLVSTRAGRKFVGAQFAKGLRPLKTNRVTVSTPAGISAGEFAFRFTITAVTNKGTLRVGFAVVRVHRAVAYMFVVAKLGSRVAAGSLVSLVRMQETHFRGGFTIGTVTAPTITGTATQGQTLTADRGRWSGGPEQLTYQWKRCDALGANCVDIAGATAATYVITPADAGFTLGVRAQATNPLSTLTAESALTAVVT